MSVAVATASACTASISRSTAAVLAADVSRFGYRMSAFRSTCRWESGRLLQHPRAHAPSYAVHQRLMEQSALLSDVPGQVCHVLVLDWAAVTTMLQGMATPRNDLPCLVSTGALPAAQGVGATHLVLLVVALLDARGRELLFPPRDDLVRLQGSHVM